MLTIVESDFNLLASDEYFDVHAIAGLLKLYLRELPTSILTSERRDDFVKVTEMDDTSHKVTALNELVHSLPIENFELLKTLSGHLLRVVGDSAVNKMTIRNVGIVFSPTLNIPAQVFSMFLHEYRHIFFRDGEARPPSPPVERVPQQPMSPRQSGFDSSVQSRALLTQRMMEPPKTPMLPSHPGVLRPQGQSVPPLQAQVINYEPNYEYMPKITSPTEFNPTRFESIAAAGSLSVPESKASKSKRRESSMMFMMGGLKKGSNGGGGSFQPGKSNGESSLPPPAHGN